MNEEKRKIVYYKDYKKGTLKILSERIKEFLINKEKKFALSLIDKYLENEFPDIKNSLFKKSKLLLVETFHENIDSNLISNKNIYNGLEAETNSSLHLECENKNIKTKKFAISGSPHKLWQLNGEYTYNRDFHLISSEHLIYHNHFHKRINIKSNLHILFLEKNRALVNYEEPFGNLPKRSLLIPNSNNFGHTILGFFPVLISSIINQDIGLKDIVLRKKYSNNSIFSQILGRLEHITKNYNFH